MALKPLNSPGGFSVGEITTGAINVISSTGNVTTGNLISNSGSTGNINIIAGNIVTAGTVFAPAIVANSGTYDTRIELGTASGIIAVTSNNNPTQFLPGGQIRLSGASQVIGGTLDGSGLTLGASQTDLFQNRGGNVTVQVGTGGTIANTWTFAQSGELLAPGNIISSGNVSGTYILGNGAFLTGIAAGYSNADVANYLPTYTGNLVSLTGNVITTANISGSYILGNGRFLDGMYGNAEVKSYLESGATINANFGTGTVTTSGNISGGNLVSSANIDGTNVNATKLASSGALTINSGSNGNINIQPNGSGNVVLSNTFINSVAYPVQDQDAASKIYVDNLVTTAISYHTSVVAATTTDLATATGGTITYDQPNGVGNGVGATLTTTGSFNLIDTANVQSANARILVKNESNGAFNGIYVWSNATAITRADDEDTYGAGSPTALGLNDYFFVTNGNVNLGSAWIVDAPNGAITFGTSNIQFAQFSQTQVYSANTSAGLTLVGQQFNAKTDNNTTAFDAGGNIIVKAGANLTTPNIGNATGSSLNVTGTVTGGNISTTGQVSATGNVSGGNITTTGQVSATGNVSGNLLLGNGYFITGIQYSNINGAYGNSNVASYLASNANITVSIGTGEITTQGNITTTGNISAGNYLGSGANTTIAAGVYSWNFNDTGNLVLPSNTFSVNYANGAQVSLGGSYSNADVANYLASNANVIITVGVSNITTQGNITGNYFIGNGALLTGLAATYSNANVANYLPTYTGNLGAGNLNLTGNIVDTGPLQIVTGASGNIGLAPGNSNVLVISTTGIDITGAITATGNITTTGNISAGNYLGSGANTAIAAGVYTWNFTDSGNIVLAGNTFAVNYANGAQVSLGGSYSNADVAAWLASSPNNFITLGNSNSNITTGGTIRTYSDSIANNFIANNYLELQATSNTAAREEAYTTQTTGTGLATVATIAVATLPSFSQALEVTMRGVDGNNTQIGKMVVTWNAAGSSDYSRYGEIILGTGCGTPSATFDGTSVLVQVTPLSANSTTWTAKVTSL
jgi:hypothetical protein